MLNIFRQEFILMFKIASFTAESVNAYHLNRMVSDVACNENGFGIRFQNFVETHLCPETVNWLLNY